MCDELIIRKRKNFDCNYRLRMIDLDESFHGFASIDSVLRIP